MGKFDFDLQMFAEDAGIGNATAPEGSTGAADGNAPTAADANTPAVTEPNPAAPGSTANKQNGGEDKTILGNGGETYDFKSIVPEGMEYNEQSAQAFSAVAKECGLNAEQAQKVAAYGMQYMQEGVNAAQAALTQQIKGWGVETKQKLGANFDATVQTAGAGIEALEKVVPGIRAALNETGAGNRLEIVQAFARMGELVREDGFRGFGSSTGQTDARYDKTDFSKY